MKNKKLLTAVLCIAIGFIMLFATAFASSAGTTGYDAYKAALKATAEAKSFTADVNLELTDGGKMLGSADMLVKAGDIGTRNVSVKGSIAADAQQKDFEVYEQTGTSVIKTSDSDIYYVSQNNYADRGMQSYNAERDPNAVKAGEAVIDALVGDLKDYFTLADGKNGGSTVDFRITGSQIPAVVNAAASLLAKENQNGESQISINSPAGLPPFMTGFHADAPKLTGDIRVDEISLKADIDGSGIITGQKMAIVISGKAADGAQHQLTINMGMTLSALGSTTADTISLEGKQTQAIDMEKYREAGSFGGK